MRKRKGLLKTGAQAAGLLVLCAGLWLSFASGVARAIPEESQRNAGPTNRTWENYFGVSILPSGRAIVVGDKGLVMTSDDQGKTWTHQQLRNGLTPFDLYSIAFTPDGAKGWIAGDGGSMYRSDDQGKTWTLQPTKTAAALMKVAVIDAQKACAVGEHGMVICTADDGATWNSQKFEDMVFFDVTFTDANNGWAVGEFETVLDTIDGGKTWTIKNGGQRTLKADPYFAIAFTDPNNGLVLGLNGIDLKTSDAGKTWTPGALADEPYSFYAAVPLTTGGSGDIYTVGVDGVTGRIARDTKMTRTVSGASNSINAIALTPQFGLAVGLSGTILQTKDSGQSWSGLNGGDSAQARAQ
jgi:photosystem II stability/assembly factor-like uncharacterized protein